MAYDDAEFTTTVVIGTPSTETVMVGDPEAALARIVSALDSEIVTVVDAVPLPTRASAFRPEALESLTIFPEPSETFIFSASTLDVVLVVVEAVAVGAVWVSVAVRREAAGAGAAAESEASTLPSIAAADTARAGALAAAEGAMAAADGAIGCTSTPPAAAGVAAGKGGVGLVDPLAAGAEAATAEAAEPLGEGAFSVGRLTGRTVTAGRLVFRAWNVVVVALLRVVGDAPDGE